MFQIASRQQRVRELRTEEGLFRAYSVGKLSAGVLARLAAAKSLGQDQKRIFAEARQRLLEAELRRSASRRRGLELSETKREIVRLREHARALRGGSSDASDAIVERLLAAEDRAKRLGVRIARLNSEAAANSEAARRTLARLGPGR